MAFKVYINTKSIMKEDFAVIQATFNAENAAYSRINADDV